MAGFFLFPCFHVCFYPRFIFYWKLWKRSTYRIFWLRTAKIDEFRVNHERFQDFKSTKNALLVLEFLRPTWLHFNSLTDCLQDSFEFHKKSTKKVTKRKRMHFFLLVTPTFLLVYLSKYYPLKSFAAAAMTRALWNSLRTCQVQSCRKNPRLSSFHFDENS